MEAAQASISGYVDKTTMGHLHNRVLLGCKKKKKKERKKKKKKILPFVTPWVDLENIMLSEISQSEEDKYHMISITYGN